MEISLEDTVKTMKDEVKELFNSEEKINNARYVFDCIKNGSYELSNEKPIGFCESDNYLSNRDFLDICEFYNMNIEKSKDYMNSVISGIRWHLYYGNVIGVDTKNLYIKEKA